MKLQNLIHMLIGIVCIGVFPAAQAVVPPPVAVGAARHETRTDSQTALQFPKGSEISAEIETVSSAPPTRSSFMASWDKVTGATGYLLDVSTSSLFSDYVDGYHDLDVGNVTGRVVTGLNPGTTYYYRVRPYTPSGAGVYSGAMTATTVATTGLQAKTTTAMTTTGLEATTTTTMATTGLIIHATFDSSITSNPNAVAIEAMINQAISIYESLFSDPITLEILFRYATTEPDGTPFSAGSLSQSDYTIYTGIPWNTVVALLRADAKTSNDNLAIASLPVSALSANVVPSSANGRAVGGDTPPAMFANGTVGPGGPYDGIVTLNSAAPFQFTRPTTAGNFDAQQSTEHEIDEVMGLGSKLNLNPPNTDLRPQDLFSWSSPGVRNLTSSGTRYFSIDGGNTNIVNFNQDPSGDFGDWLNTGCLPLVQVAFACTGQSSDVASTSPEGINLDVIGYDLVALPAPPPVVNAGVSTGRASNITRSSAVLHGWVNPNGLTTTVAFQYGRSANYGRITANQTFTGNTAQRVSVRIPRLRANTTYHFRLVATNNGGTSNGSDRTFRTSR
jgi:hypothetical protein